MATYPHLLQRALQALENSSAIVYKDPAHASLRQDVIAELTAALADQALVVGGDHVAIPVVLDEPFAKAVAVVNTLDEDDIAFAHDAWEYIVEEARSRQRIALETNKDAP